MTFRHLRRWVPVALLLAFFAMGLVQVRYASITFDEGPHLAVGYSTLRTGDLRLQPVHIHPPLANVLAALPLLLQTDLPDPEALAGWNGASLSAITEAVVWRYPAPARIATAGRVPILLLATLLGALVHRWATDLGGRLAGLIALVLYALDPSLISHGSLITTDAAATALIAATLYAAYRWAIAPEGATNRSLWLALMGAFAGLAQLAKVSAISAIPVLGVVVLWKNLSSRPLREAVGRSGIQMVAVIGVIGFVVWAGYGFEVRPLAGLPFVVPAATHLAIYRSLGEHYDLGHPAFALGRISDSGWWWYFPLAFLVKTPLPALLTMGAAAGARLFPGRGKAPRTAGRRVKALRLVPVVFIALYVAISLLSSVNIGYRHLLPILPLAYIAAAQSLARRLRHRRQLPQAVKATIGLIVGWLVVGTLAVLPSPLTYFNELAGGPSGGYRYLVDSNLDWGQDLWALQTWMADRGETQVRYAHYSPADPTVYGIDAQLLPPDPRAVTFSPWRPEPGLYAIGATVLQGPYAPDINTYAWFRDREPDAVLGRALFVYRVDPQPASEISWLVACRPLDQGRVSELVGMPDLRMLSVTCEYGQVYPRGGGLYLSASGVRPLAQHRAAFKLRAADGTDAAVLWDIQAAPNPGTLTEARPLEGPLTFLGYTLNLSGEAVIVDAFWRVNDVPDRPLSLMAHLAMRDGTTIAVGDGLAVPIDQWQPGDLIVQRHLLAQPSASEPPATAIRLGAYWLDTLERMHVIGEEDLDSLVFPISDEMAPDGT